MNGQQRPSDSSHQDYPPPSLPKLPPVLTTMANIDSDILATSHRGVSAVPTSRGKAIHPIGKGDEAWSSI